MTVYSTHTYSISIEPNSIKCNIEKRYIHRFYFIGRQRQWAFFSLSLYLPYAVYCAALCIKQTTYTHTHTHILTQHKQICARNENMFHECDIQMDEMIKRYRERKRESESTTVEVRKRQKRETAEFLLCIR